MMDEKLLGKCGFYCGSCPTYRNGKCAGCMDAHGPGDCFTRDCVLAQGFDCCGACQNFPCDELFRRKKATVLDREWLQWKRRSRSE